MITGFSRWLVTLSDLKERSDELEMGVEMNAADASFYSRMVTPPLRSLWSVD